ncbi:MAG TPA: HAD-IIIA family hydrolase [Vicinamibacterales bacterium]|nr:HAD-IIIA family hydrolase [Vicinamibacterales bacterium]
MDELAAKAAKVKLILLDVDGVLTDGAVVIYGDGSESKRFHIRDGIALVWAQRAGIKVGLLSARQSPTTVQRAAQLGITLIHQGVSSKISTYDQIVGDMVLTDDEVAYMGDDIVDLAVLGRVGLSAAPANAVAEVRSRVDFVSGFPGGDGAVRELVEIVLRAKKQWDPLVAAYEAEAQS